jgi:hypothetical protein
MIAKGSQRGGGQQLATHLSNAFDNERVEVAEVRGAIASDLHGAFAEWRAAAKGTKCRKYLYSLSINPDPEQGPLTRNQYFDFMARVEKELGLTDQPRAVVFHVKEGREHCHVVWSRIDLQRMRAVHISHDRQKLRSVSRGFARDHQLELPARMRVQGAKDRFNARARGESLAERQQQERSGISKEERRREVMDAWRESRTGQELIAALERRGYLIAQGERRAYVIVDRAGEIHSLSRQIAGVKAAEIRARLAEYPAEKLPKAATAQEFARHRREEGRGKASAADAASAARQRTELARAHKERRAALAEKRAQLERQHRLECEALIDAQSLENVGIAAGRAPLQRGVMAVLTRITGIRFLLDWRHKRQDVARAIEHERQRDALGRRHSRELHDFRHLERAAAGVEKRERRSLETSIRREAFRAASGAALARQQSHPVIAGQPRARDSQPRPLRDAFAHDGQKASPAEPAAARDQGLSRTFNETRTRPESGNDRKPDVPDEKTLSSGFRDAAEGRPQETDIERRARELMEEFRRSAASRRRENRTRDRGPDRGR